MVSEYAGRIDLLVTDVVVPRLSGQGLGEDLAAPRTGIRVLFTSGYTAGAIAGHGAVREGVRLLWKPNARLFLTQAVPAASVGMDWLNRQNSREEVAE